MSKDQQPIEYIEITDENTEYYAVPLEESEETVEPPEDWQGNAHEMFYRQDPDTVIEPNKEG